MGWYTPPKGENSTAMSGFGCKILTGCNLVYSLEQENRMYRLCCIAGALSMLSIHSPDFVFTVLVSIFINKTIIISEHHLKATLPPDMLRGIV